MMHGAGAVRRWRKKIKVAGTGILKIIKSTRCQHRGSEISAILMVVCISIVVVSPMLLMIERGPETAASSLLLVAVSLIQINSVIVGGAASRAVGMVLASLAVAMFICSLLEELIPEESARNIIVDRGKCVNSSKDWSSRIGNICDGIFRKDGFFYLDENVTQEDTEWPLKVFKISKGVRERIP